MIKTYQIKLNPTKTQLICIEKAIYQSRKLYNLYLEACIKEKKLLDLSTFKQDLNIEWYWEEKALNYANLELSNYLRQNHVFPKFRNKYHHDTKLFLNMEAIDENAITITGLGSIPYEGEITALNPKDLVLNCYIDEYDYYYMLTLKIDHHKHHINHDHQDLIQAKKQLDALYKQYKSNKLPITKLQKQLTLIATIEKRIKESHNEGCVR